MTPTTEAAGPSIIRLATVDSTQAVAFALAADGRPDRTVVVADYQRQGRGRRGRSWHAEPGTSLLGSILIRPALPAARQPLYSFATAVAVAEALAATAGAAPTLRWPNDVLLNDRKVAGILLEARGGTPPALVIGIGVNLHQEAFPADLRAGATSVLLETGRFVDRDQILHAVLRSFDRWRGRLEREGFASVRARWRALSSTIGRRVAVDCVDGADGVAVDLADDGALLVVAETRQWRVTAGALREPPPPAAVAAAAARAQVADAHAARR